MANNLQGDTGRRVFDGLIARGFPPVHASVLAGNIQQESSFNPAAWNPKESAGGLLQWRKDRLDNLLNYAATTGRAADDLDTQLDYLVEEMLGNYGTEGGKGAAFLSAKDPESANRALKGYIRYGDNSEGQRLKYALGYVPKEAPANRLVADAGAFVNPSFSGEMPGVPAPSQAPLPAPAPLAFEQPAAPVDVPLSNSDDDLLRAFFPDEGVPLTANGGSVVDDDLLKAFIPDGAPSTALDDYRKYVDEHGIPGQGALAFADQAIEAIPIAGPSIKEGLEAARGWLGETASNLTGGAIGGTRADMDAFADAAVRGAPIEAGVGQAFGTVAPIAALGMTPVGGAMLGTAGNLLTRTGMSAASSGVIGGLDTLARGGTDEQAGQNALLAGAVGGAVPLVGGAVGAGINRLLSGTSQNVAELARLATDRYGIPVGPGQISENPMIRYADSAVNKLPFSGGTVSNAQQQTAFNRAVANTFGENADTITPDVMTAARNRIGSEFDRVAQATTTRADPTFDNEMLTIIGNAQQALTEQQVGPLMRQFDAIVGKFQQGGGAIDGQVYQELTKRGAPLDVAMQSADPGIRQFARQMRGALDGALERSAIPADVDALRQARQQWWALKTIEDLAEKAPAGDISPALLMGAVRGNLDTMAYGGGGDLANLARIGQQFLKQPPSSGTAERLAIGNLLTKAAAPAGILGLALNPGAIPMAATTAAFGVPAYLTAARGAGSLLRSPGLANRLIDNSLGVAQAVPTAPTTGNVLMRSVPPAFMPRDAGGNPLLAPSALGNGAAPLEIVVRGGATLQ